MLYVIRYVFGEDVDEARTAARTGHLEYLQGAGARLKLAGPIAAGHAETDGAETAEAEGSLLIIDAGSLTAARLFVQNDPYYKADIVATLKIKAFKAVIGDWAL